MKSRASHDDKGHPDPYNDENEFNVLACEAQEPDDADPNLGDFWDSLT